MYHKIFLFSLFAAYTILSAGDFSIESTGTQTRIGFQGKPFVESVTPRITGKTAFAQGVQHNSLTLPDGGKAYNIWNTDPASCFRQESVISADGNRIELSLLSYNEAYKGYPGKNWELVLPFSSFDGAEYEALMINGRSWTKHSGKLSSDMPDGPVDKRMFRFFAVKKGEMKLLFDLMPHGPGDFFNCYQKMTIRGIWSISKRGNKLIISLNAKIPASGGYVGGKVRILRGTFADYGRLHALKSFHYAMSLPAQHQFSFGAKQTGKNYTHADDLPFNTAKGFGWRDNKDLKSSVQSPQGAWYSHIAGRDKTFRITGLADGIHIITAGIGNYDGADNSFQVSLNGKLMSPEKLSVPQGKALILTQAVWVKGGHLDIQFSGDFLLSTLSTQFLLAEPEDVSFRRSFWVSAGFEPAPLYRTADWHPAAESFPGHKSFVVLPEPGKECAAPLRMPERLTVMPKPDDPELMWRYNANIIGLGGNTSSDWKDEKVLKKHLKKLKSNGNNAVMAGVLFSPHCYPDALPRDMEMHARLIQTVHEAGLKVMEHHDTTLLWNVGQGFRVLCERISETERDVVTGLPNPRFCFRNEKFKKQYFEFAKRLASMGIDMFQLDEAYFFDRGCVCDDCRRAFHEETGWYLPMNELDKQLSGKNTPLMKAWFNWKMITEGNWFAELGRELQKINPHLSFSRYTTHWGFIKCLPSNNSSTDLEELARATAFFGTEVMTRNPLASGRALVPLRKALNLLNFAYGTPIWGIFYNTHFDARYFSYALSNMNKQQALLSYLPAPSGRRDYQPFAANPDNMDRVKAKAMAEIALLYSRSSRDWNSRVPFDPELFGLAQTLEEIHIPYQVIGESSLKAEQLKQFKALSIGSSGCLSDEQVKIIKEFAFNGGTVLLSDIAGVFDATGSRRPVWAFADVFKFTTRVTPAKNIKELISSDGKQVILKRPVFYWEPKPLCRDNASWMVQVGKNRLPVWITRKYGKGRMIYQPVQMAGALYAREGAVGKKWGFERDDKLAELLHTVLEKQLAEARLWTTDAPEKVYTTLYREPERILIHFLNGTGTSLLRKNDVMSATIGKDNFPPVKDDIHFTLEKVPFAKYRVYAGSPDFEGRKTLPFRKDGKGVRVTLSKNLLNIYTIVIVAQEK